jgi:hypothetical protein
MRKTGARVQRRMRAASRRARPVICLRMQRDSIFGGAHDGGWISRLVTVENMRLHWFEFV